MNTCLRKLGLDRIVSKPQKVCRQMQRPITSLGLSCASTCQSLPLIHTSTVTSRRHRSSAPAEGKRRHSRTKANQGKALSSTDEHVPSNRQTIRKHANELTHLYQTI